MILLSLIFFTLNILLGNSSEKQIMFLIHSHFGNIKYHYLIRMILKNLAKFKSKTNVNLNLLDNDDGIKQGFKNLAD